MSKIAQYCITVQINDSDEQKFAVQQAKVASPEPSEFDSFDTESDESEESQGSVLHETVQDETVPSKLQGTARVEMEDSDEHKFCVPENEQISI